MPKYGHAFESVITLSAQKKFEEARQASLQLQVLKPRNEGGSQGIKMQPVALSELQNWLASAPVEKAQRKLVLDKANDVISAATKFKKDAGHNSPLKFNEFVFFYGFSVQGGLAGVADGVFQKATSRLREHKAYALSEAERKRQLINYIAAWLRVQWPDTKNPAYFADAARNADLLEKEGSNLTLGEIQMLYTKMFRASVGNQPYKIVFVNRGVADLLGYGYVNGSIFDNRTIYSKRSALQRN